MKRLATAPGIGLVRAAYIVAVVMTPHRFRTARQFWSYSGLAVMTRSSSDCELAPTLPDYKLFAALPGAGPALAPRLLVAFGERRERFPNAAALQKYAGVAPVTERSGNKSWVHWRYSCPTFLRQTFVEWVGQTIPRSFWAKTFYEARRARGARHQAALRALAFKWIRVLHRCWIDHIPYDESRYLMALQKRHAPLLKFAADSRT